MHEHNAWGPNIFSFSLSFNTTLLTSSFISYHSSYSHAMLGLYFILVRCFAYQSYNSCQHISYHNIYTFLDITIHIIHISYHIVNQHNHIAYLEHAFNISYHSYINSSNQSYHNIYHIILKLYYDIYKYIHRSHILTISYLYRSIYISWLYRFLNLF